MAKDMGLGESGEQRKIYRAYGEKEGKDLGHPRIIVYAYGELLGDEPRGADESSTIINGTWGQVDEVREVTLEFLLL